MGITLGIIGGIAPPSTVDYYLVGDGRIAELMDWLAAEIDRLARAGAGCALLAANTPHVVFDELRAVHLGPLA